MERREKINRKHILLCGIGVSVHSGTIIQLSAALSDVEHTGYERQPDVKCAQLHLSAL